MLSIQNLVKTYGTQQAVDNISFEVQAGEIVGFLGPNGAGKSTTMKIATGYIPKTSGTVIVNGFDVEESPIEVKRSVGYLPEHNPLYLDMFVKEYLEFVGQLYGLKGQQLQNKIKETIERVGLGIEQHKKIGALSKGYRQRTGLASALIHSPKVLILDEPTTGLDPNQLVEIRQVIKDLGKDQTVVFSSHIMQEVQAICKRVVIINQGKIVADGALDELRKGANGLYIYLLELETSIDINLLKSIPGIASVKSIGTNSYQLTAPDNKEDARGKISKFVVDNGHIILSLQKVENSLEQVFQNLTGKN